MYKLIYVLTYATILSFFLYKKIKIAFKANQSLKEKNDLLVLCKVTNQSDCSFLLAWVIISLALGRYIIPIGHFFLSSFG